MLLSDTESEDGDIEEANHISASGEATLVSHGLLRSRIDNDADEPALRNSLLLQDTELN